MSKHLFVSPHPDDVEIGCGGLIHKLRRAGDEAEIAVCAGPGDLLMVHSGETVPFDTRKLEQRRAARLLMVDTVHWLDLAAASKFDQTPQAAFVTAFDALFAKFDAVYLPLPSYNDDHTRVWKAGLAAFRPGKLDRTSLFAYEQPFGNSLDQATFGRRYVPLRADDIAAKQVAIQAHHSQVKGRLHTIYGPMGAQVQSMARGMEIGQWHAEMIYLVREVVD